MRRPVFASLLAAVSGSIASAQTVAQPLDSATARWPDESPGIRPEHIWTGDYAKLVWDDTLSIVTAPARWDEGQWLKAAGAVAVVAVTVPFDHTVHKEVQRHRTPGEDRFMQRWQNFGSGYSFVVLSGFEAWGELGNNLRAKNVAMDGLAASIIASGLITPAVKFAVGRERSSSNQGAFRFKPFSNNNSFPSGHATQAFAVATVIAENYPCWWVDTLAYGSAALVGYARIEQDAHFASDVVAGAIIGWSVANSIVHRHDGHSHANKFTWSPYATGNGGGLVLAKTF